MAREERDPLGHLRQGLQWQAEADYRARLNEFDVPGIVRRFHVTHPPSDALEELDTRLRKLNEAIWSNPRAPAVEMGAGGPARA